MKVVFKFSYKLILLAIYNSTRRGMFMYSYLQLFFIYLTFFFVNFKNFVCDSYKKEILFEKILN